jgi:hypothetical protein
MTSYFRIFVDDITDALERAQIGQAAFQREYTTPTRTPGWCVRLTPSELPEFCAELVIAVAQRKAVAAKGAITDARDDTVEACKMMRWAEVAPDTDQPLLMVFAVFGCTVVDDVEQATV